MTKVKICGLSTPEGMTAAIEAGADFVGLVFYPPSPRHVDIEVARYLAGFVPEHIERVGLFVNPDDEMLAHTVQSVPLSMIQLHGSESVERVREVQAKFGLPVIKALPMDSPADLKAAQEYDGVAEWLLFDAKPEALPGGNGVAFDWSLLAAYQGQSPWMLAGGLTPENVADALKIVHPDAVDVSSGVEAGAGQKDATKIQAFLERVKRA